MAHDHLSAFQLFFFYHFLKHLLLYYLHTSRLPLLKGYVHEMDFFRYWIYFRFLELKQKNLWDFLTIFSKKLFWLYCDNDPFIKSHM
jgi:hypothetical protein